MHVARWLAVASILAVATWISAGQLIEAYGAGPPYFSRTTNMDKWTSPLPSLLLIDGVALLAALLIAPRGKSRKRP